MANGINAPFGLSPYISNVGKADITKMMPYGIGFQIVNAGQANAGAITTLPYNIYSGDPVVFSGMYLNVEDNAAQWIGLNAANSSPVNTAGSVVPLSAIPGTIMSPDPVAFGRLNAPIVGVGISARYNNPNNIYNVEYPFWPASTQVQSDVPPIMYVNDDPQALFTVQCSTSNGNYNNTLFNLNMIGQNVALSVGGLPITENIPAALTVANNPGSGNNLTGQSAYYADLSTIGNGAYGTVTSGANAQLNFKILGMIMPSNVYNVGNQNIINAAMLNQFIPGVNMPFMTIFGKINNHVYGAATPSIQIA